MVEFPIGQSVTEVCREVMIVKGPLTCGLLLSVPMSTGILYHVGHGIDAGSMVLRNKHNLLQSYFWLHR